MAAVATDGSTVCVLILRLNSSCSRSIALVVRTLRHWPGGSRVKGEQPVARFLQAVGERGSETMCKQVSVNLPYRGDSHGCEYDDYS